MSDTTYTLGEIAQRVGATVIGDPSIQIKSLASLQHAQPHHLSFLANPKYKAQLLTTQAGAVLLKEQDAEGFNGNALLVADPYACFAMLTHQFDLTPKPALSRVHPISTIAKTARIDPTASIGAYVVIDDHVVIGPNTIIESHCHIAEGVIIGESCWIDKHVVIQHRCQLGDRVRVHAGTVIGGDGFGFAPYQGRWHRIAQLGRVIIGNDVRVGANCTIDRGALDDTLIGHGVIMDNLVQIAHNVQIGDHTAIAAQAAVAGSTIIGKHCIIGGATGIAGHLEITDNVQFTGMSMVTKSITRSGTYSSGTSISDNNSWKKMVVGLRQLADTPISKIIKRIEELQVRIERVESTHIVTTKATFDQDEPNH